MATLRRWPQPALKPKPTLFPTPLLPLHQRSLFRDFPGDAVCKYVSRTPCHGLTGWGERQRKVPGGWANGMPLRNVVRRRCAKLAVIDLHPRRPFLRRPWKRGFNGRDNGQRKPYCACRDCRAFRNHVRDGCSSFATWTVESRRTCYAARQFIPEFYSLLGQVQSRESGPSRECSLHGTCHRARPAARGRRGCAGPRINSRQRAPRSRQRSSHVLVGTRDTG